MKVLLFGCVTIMLGLAAPRFAAADDVWDLNGAGPGNDDDATTPNELTNGSVQTHDLQVHSAAVQDQDWFLLGQQPYSSYEVLVDSLTWEIGTASLERVDTGGAVINSATGYSNQGSARTLRFRNATASPIVNQFVRMGAPLGCGPTCSALAQYRITFYETNYLIPRFNNSASQVTIMVVQNGSQDTVAGTARFWNAAGALLASQDISLSPKGMAVVNTSGVAGLAGQSGSITIDHDGRYGSLSGKAVALEPATGFTFDTAMSARIH